MTAQCLGTKAPKNHAAGAKPCTCAALPFWHGPCWASAWRLWDWAGGGSMMNGGIHQERARRLAVSLHGKRVGMQRQRAARHLCGEARASTETIDSGYGLQHRSVLQLLRRYATEVEEFGQLAFEMRNSTLGAGRPTEYALLNELQILESLIGLLESVDDLTQDQIKPSLKRMIDEPHRGREIIDRIEAAIELGNKARPEERLPESTNSNAGWPSPIRVSSGKIE